MHITVFAIVLCIYLVVASLKNQIHWSLYDHFSFRELRRLRSFGQSTRWLHFIDTLIHNPSTVLHQQPIHRMANCHDNNCLDISSLALFNTYPKCELWLCYTILQYWYGHSCLGTVAMVDICVTWMFRPLDAMLPAYLLIKHNVWCAPVTECKIIGFHNLQI